MKDFLKKIVGSIVDKEESVEIKEEVGNGLTTYTIVVPQDEIGKVIGKRGKVINALRTLARLKAMKKEQRVLIKVEEAQKENGFSLPTKTGTAKPASG